MTPPDERRDLELMQRIRSGCQEAFIELVERWEEDLTGFFRLLGADAHEVDDCLQEVFLRVFRYRHRFRPGPGERFRPFLLRIARNAYIDLLRRKRRGPPCVELEHAAFVPEGRDCPSVRTGERLDLELALERLPERLRLVLVLNAYEGLSYAEVARVLEIPVGTVKSRVFYALKALREVLCDKLPA